MKITKFISLRIMEICFIVGPCFMLGAAGFAIKDLIFLHSANKTSGIVTGIGAAQDESKSTFTTSFRFTAADGHPYLVTSGLTTSQPNYNIGDSVPIAYDPASPGEASITSAKEMWSLIRHFGIAGMIALLVGTYLWRQNWPAYLPNDDTQENYKRIKKVET